MFLGCFWSLNFQETFWNFLTELQLQWILNIICPMQAIRYLFQQPSDSSIQREKNASLTPVVLCFTAFKQVNFVMFIHLPKFLISAIQAWGFSWCFGMFEGIGLRVRSSLLSVICYFAFLPLIFVSTLKLFKTMHFNRLDGGNWVLCCHKCWHSYATWI